MHQSASKNSSAGASTHEPLLQKTLQHAHIGPQGRIITKKEDQERLCTPGLATLPGPASRRTWLDPRQSMLDLWASMVGP
eukprot:1157509-Pelagomonas_calceolata.AAC.10